MELSKNEHSIELINKNKRLEKKNSEKIMMLDENQINSDNINVNNGDNYYFNNNEEGYNTNKPLISINNNSNKGEKMIDESNKSDKIENKNKLKKLNLVPLKIDDSEESETSRKFNKAIFLCKIALKHVRIKTAYEHAEDAIINCETELSNEHRTIISKSFKSFIFSKRNEFKSILLIYLKEKEFHSKLYKASSDMKSNTENEILKIAERQIFFIDKYILKNTSSNEGFADIYQLKADIYRYLCEVSTGEHLITNKKNATFFYNESIKYSKSLSYLSLVKISNNLNFAVYCYDILSKPDLALSILTPLFYSITNELNKNKNKDFIANSTDEYIKALSVIVNIIKDNIVDWTAEIEIELKMIIKDANAAPNTLNNKET